MNINKYQYEKLLKKKYALLISLFLVVTSIILILFVTHYLTSDILLIESICFLVLFCLLIIISYKLGIIFNNSSNYYRTIVTELEKNENKFRQAIEYSPIGQALVAPDGRWLSVNPALCNLVGYSEKELLKINFQTITHPDDLEGDLELLQQVLENKIKTYQLDKRYFHKNGYIIWIQLNVSLVRDEQNQPLFFISQIQDITDRKKIIENLHNEQQNSKKYIEEINSLVYIISHDLKEPLRGIYNYSNFLIEDYSNILQDEGKEQLATLMRLSLRMEQQLNDLLMYSKVVQAEETLDVVDLNKLVTNIIIVYKTNYLKQEDYSVDIKIKNHLPKINGEASFLEALFSNLIENGIKYNLNKERVVEIGYNQSDINNQHFYVKDNGIGIDEKYRDSVFKIFKRLNSRAKFPEGTGAGLTIAKKVVELYHGRIWFESVMGKGTIFYFTLKRNSINDSTDTI